MKLRLFPRSIGLQLIALVSIAALIYHVCMSVTFIVERNAREPLLPPGSERLVNFINAIDLLPADRRASYLERFTDATPGVHVKLLPPATELPLGAPSDNWSRILASRLPGGSRLGVTDDRLWIGTPSGAKIAVDKGREFGPPPFGDLVFGTSLFVALSATLFLVWAIRNITMPLATFAAAADSFALDEDDELLNDSGPKEVRTASRALNRMRERIRLMMSDRTRMLAAIGHDLRTPITRLRLRAEFIQDPALRQSIIRDLDHMDIMVHGALDFLRDTSKATNMQPLDIASLLQSVCDDFTDTGSNVGYQGPGHLAIIGQSNDLRRLFSNLLANAVSHGQRVIVCLEAMQCQRIEVDVIDDGPGMTKAEKQHAFEPFWRGSTGDTGFGLGLSIADAITKQHGGSITLLDAPDGGLCCRVRLPANLAAKIDERTQAWA